MKLRIFFFAHNKHEFIYSIKMHLLTIISLHLPPPFPMKAYTNASVSFMIKITRLFKGGDVDEV